jgi:hypothetical protein
MKKLLLIVMSMLFMSTSFASQRSCGVREAAASLATLDMEIDLLHSGLYSEVRNESMIRIASIIRNHLVMSETCNDESQALKQTAIATIDSLIINNPDRRNYSISTAIRLYSAIRNSVSALDSVAGQYLDGLIQAANH